jgi:hypothetical protein
LTDHGYREVALSRIVLPGSLPGFAKAHAEQVAALSESRKALLLAHPITVEATTMRLVAGRRRVAGLLADGVKRAWVHLVEGTPRELERLAASENLHRGNGDDLGELRAAYVEAIEADLAVEAAELTDKRPRKPGRPKTPKGEARERAARDLGTTPEALRKAEERVEARAAPAAKVEIEIEPAVIMYGLRAGAMWQMVVNDLAVQLDDIAAKLTALIGRTAPIPAPSVSQAARLAVQQAGAAIRALRPHMACVFCRDPDGAAGRRALCSACSDLGWLTQEQSQRVPAEQLLPDAQPIVRLPAESAGARAFRGEPAPSTRWPRQISIQDEAGRELAVERDDEDVW